MILFKFFLWPPFAAKSLMVSINQKILIDWFCLTDDFALHSSSFSFISNWRTVSFFSLFTEKKSLIKQKACWALTLFRSRHSISLWRRKIVFLRTGWQRHLSDYEHGLLLNSVFVPLFSLVFFCNIQTIMKLILNMNIYFFFVCKKYNLKVEKLKSLMISFYFLFHIFCLFLFNSIKTLE